MKRGGVVEVFPDQEKTGKYEGGVEQIKEE